MTEHASLAEALLAFQAEAMTLQATAINEGFKKKDGTPSKYVPLEELMTAVLPKLNEHGLVWLTMPCMAEGVPSLRYKLTHVTEDPAVFGQTIEGTMPLAIPAAASAQAQGSAITYARRYSMMAVLGLVAERDDDGQRAARRTPAAKPLLSGAQLDELRAACRGLKAQVIKTALTVRGIAHGPTPAQMFWFVTPEQFTDLCDELMAANR